MGDRESTMRSVVMSYFPMFIATLSLVTSIYNGYLNGKFVDFIQRNVSRVDYMHTCKEIIDAYFQVKFRAGVIASGREAGGDEIAGDNAVAKFAALGTYLANLRDESVRAQYTALSREVEKAVRGARGKSASELAESFWEADRMFLVLNNDCVAQAKGL
jgi:hypothetical protein